MAALMSYFAPPIAGEWGDEAEDNTDGVPVLRTTNFTADGRLSYDDLTYRSIDTEKKENKILQLGDIIIEKSGGTPKKPVGRCVYFDRDDEYDYFCSNFTAILRANTEEVNTKYLWYILQEHYKTRQCLKYQYKTNGIANLDIKDYLSHKEVELPPREVQDKRVEAMDYSQHLLDLHQELLDIMDNAVKSRFVEMFGDPHHSSLYPYRIVKEFTNICSGGTPSRKIDSYWKEGTIRWVKTTELQNCVIYDTEEKITLEALEKSSAKLVPADTVLIAMYGQGKTRGMTGYLNVESTTNQACACILPSKEVNQKYLWRYFMMSYEELRGLAVGAGQPNLTGDMIKNFPVLMPPLELQEEYVAFAELADKSKLTIQKSMDNLMELRNSLLQEYFG